ncbi:hypothetical protein AQUSIP_01540 [Aquicella siphonis]|uniref:ABC transporter substrate-binding protein n=1 Tax=Aquicella siphonis TaxID=254247 RepID=A0A5E4PDA8_9COXI|nr:ABC transporter substrate binding protein [Aquicella siphonis]VVC74880.1 hypothetical protein AQUSIP_01540 [Aquicella siphonis]
MTVFSNMIKILFLTFFAAALAGCKASANEKKIGIIVPIEHKAMDEIVDGFTKTLSAKSSYPLRFKVANAQADMNLQRAIIQQMKSEGYDMIVPIGSDATQMSVSSIQKQPIVSLASSLTQQDRSRLKTCNIAVVHDEISAERLLQFIHQAYPEMQRIVLIHSAADKVFPEVEAAVTAGKNTGITIKPVMVPTLNELYGTANNLPADAQGILVLKDSLIVSGISTLEKAAAKQQIPLITSDQGSVQDGAGFALGVHERDIGVEGANLAAAILSGKNPCSLPITTMSKLTVFVNNSSLDQEKQSFAPIQSAAEKLHYTLEPVNKTDRS